jgi:hypothetical protein
MKLDGILPDEQILSDDYPVYCSYLYVCDGKVKESPSSGRVKSLKIELKVNEVRNCQLAARGFFG